MRNNKQSHEYICLNEHDQKYLDESYLEGLLDTRERQNVPIRSDNVRKSIEHHLERQRLKREIADFDWNEPDPYGEH